MSPAEHHLAELLKLPAEDRSAIAEALLLSLEEDVPDPNVEQAWVEEIQHRINESAPGIPSDKVFAEGRAKLKISR